MSNYQINLTPEQWETIGHLLSTRFTCKYFRILDVGDGVEFYPNDEMKPVCVVLRDGGLRGAGV